MCPFLISLYLNSKIVNDLSPLKIEAVCVHPHAFICDLERNACHLQIKHKGSILHIYPYFAALILLPIIFHFPQHELISAKKAKLRELVGEVKKMNQRGRQWWGLVERPQHTVQVVHPLFLFEFCLNFALKYYLKLLLFCNLSFPFLLFFPSVRRFCWGGSSQIANQGREGHWHSTELGAGGGLSSSTWRGGTGAVGRGNIYFTFLSCCFKWLCCASPLFPFLSFIL